MKPEMETVTNRAELAALISDCRDDEIVEMATTFGVDEVLSMVFAQMTTEYVAKKGPRRESVIEWDIDGPDRTRVWQMTASREGISITPDGNAKPRATLRMSLAVFLRIIARVSNGTVELAKGKVKLKGDLTIAASIDGWFPGNDN